MSIERPSPSPDPLTAPYWEAAVERKLRLPRCRACEKWHFYPRSLCPHCGSADLEWRDAEGCGEVFSFSVIHRAPSPAFAADVPYVVAIVSLAEGPHLMTNIVGCAPGSVRIGMPVAVDFKVLDDGASLPVFRPAR
jgi:uncharacterized OB-fold protein